MGNQFAKGRSWNAIAERFNSWRIMEQRSCYAKRYCNLYSETTTDNPTSDGETILFYVCRVLNTTVWPQLIDSNKDEEVNFQFSSLQSTAVLTDSSSSLVLNLLHVKCYKVDMQISYAMSINKAYNNADESLVWSNICLGNKEKESWHDIILLCYTHLGQLFFSLIFFRFSLMLTVYEKNHMFLVVFVWFVWLLSNYKNSFFFVFVTIWVANIRLEFRSNHLRCSI